MRLTLPYPPSANRYWRVWRGRMVKSEAAREYQQNAKLSLLAGWRQSEWQKAFAGPVRVEIDVYRPTKRGDLDNSIKVLLDALKGVAFVDDDQVVELTAARHDDKANPRVEVNVTPWEER